MRLQLPPHTTCRRPSHLRLPYHLLLLPLPRRSHRLPGRPAAGDPPATAPFPRPRAPTTTATVSPSHSPGPCLGCRTRPPRETGRRHKLLSLLSLRNRPSLSRRTKRKTASRVCLSTLRTMPWASHSSSNHSNACPDMHPAPSHCPRRPRDSCRRPEARRVASGRRLRAPMRMMQTMPSRSPRHSTAQATPRASAARVSRAAC